MGDQYFQEIRETTFQNVEAYTNPQPCHPMGRRRMGGIRTMKQGPKTNLQAVSMICPGEQAQVKLGPAPPPHRTGGRPRGTKGQQPLSNSLARMSATSTPVHQEDSKFFTKKRRSDSTSAPRSRDTKQTVP